MSTPTPTPLIPFTKPGRLVRAPADPYLGLSIALQVTLVRAQWEMLNIRPATSVSDFTRYAALQAIQLVRIRSPSKIEDLWSTIALYIHTDIGRT